VRGMDQYEVAARVDCVAMREAFGDQIDQVMDQIESGAGKSGTKSGKAVASALVDGLRDAVEAAETLGAYVTLDGSDTTVAMARELMSLIEPGSAFSFDFSQGRMLATGAVRTKDGEAYWARYAELMHKGVNGLVVEGPTKGEVDGVEVHQLRLKAKPLATDA